MSILYAGGILAGGPAPAGLTQDRFVFNGYSLHDITTKCVQEIDYDDLPTIDYVTYNAPRINGGGVLGHYFRRRNIKIKLSLRSTTVSGLNALIDEFKKNIHETEGWLEIDINNDGVIRRVKASVTNLQFNREHFNISFVSNVQITFATMDPFWQAKTNDSGTFTGITSNLTEEIVNDGTIDSNMITYFIFGTPISGLDEVKLIMGGFTITISETITNGDVLIIDGTTKSVTLNGTTVDYTGAFAELVPGNNNIQYEFKSGATYTVDITYLFNKNYL